MYDYHLHSWYSHDSQADPYRIVEWAEKMGLEEICFTEHVEFDENKNVAGQIQMGEYAACIEELQRHSRITVRLGAEIGLKDAGSFAQAYDFIKDYPIDFIIGSVHWTDEGDAYFPPFFAGRDKETAYRSYLELAFPRCTSSANYQVFGHFDYPAKKAPYEDRAMRYEMAPDAFDRLFRYFVEHGIGIEVNTSVYRTKEEKMWGLDLLKRYAQLGGEYVTVGSDAHVPERIGWRINDAIELVRRAGIRYVATFERQKPILHRI